MKAITSLTAGLLLASVGFVSNSDVPQSSNINLELDVLLSCLWITYCGDPDIYSPVMQPKESKTETKDQKAIKLA